MALTINLNNNINNTSLQIGDVAYFVDNLDISTSITYSPEEIKIIGEITAIGDNSITIETEMFTPSIDDFIMFSKDKRANNTSLLGYYAEVKLSNDSTEKAELFALGSEIAPSSK
jgi:hypothetical protein